MSKIGKKIPCRSCLTEAILVIGKKIVRFKMFDEVGIKQSFENLGNSRSESNRAIVGGVRAVTLLRYRLNKCMLPRRRISTGNKDEAKKTTKNRRQFLSKFPWCSEGIGRPTLVSLCFAGIGRVPIPLGYPLFVGKGCPTTPPPPFRFSSENRSADAAQNSPQKRIPTSGIARYPHTTETVYVSETCRFPALTHLLFVELTLVIHLYSL